jgi:hypothetical protein
MIAEVATVAIAVDSVEVMQVTLKSAVKVADVAAMTLDLNELKSQSDHSAVSLRQSQNMKIVRLATNDQFATIAHPQLLVQSAPFALIDIQKLNALKNQIAPQR